MNRIAGIISAVVGLVIFALGVSKTVPGITGTGFMLILLGGLMIGLSFVPKPASDDVPRMSTASTLINIFFSPTEVFQNLRRHPRWLAAVLIMSLMSTIFLNLFMYRLTPERIANYTIDKTLEISFIKNNEEARKNVEAGRAQAIADTKNPVLRAGQAVNSFAGQVLLNAFLALVFFLFAMVMGGRINYWQAFSSAVYASFPVAVLRFVLNSIVLFIKDPVDIHPVMGQSSLLQDNLGFLVTASESPALYVLLSSISLTLFYWLWMNATGLKNTGERVSSGTAWAATLTIFVVMLLFGLTIALVFPSFMS
jgi:hypothetical protein